jgi:hypothetical protein
MLPGFTGLTNPTQSSSGSGPAVRLAGLWDPPPAGTCKFARTDTFCTGLVLWCKDVFVCYDGRTIFGHEESRTPYPCGVCVGVSDPSDW